MYDVLIRWSLSAVGAPMGRRWQEPSRYVAVAYGNEIRDRPDVGSECCRSTSGVRAGKWMAALDIGLRPWIERNIWGLRGSGRFGSVEVLVPGAVRKVNGVSDLLRLRTGLPQFTGEADRIWVYKSNLQSKWAYSRARSWKGDVGN